jgi:hypothetical protein
MSRTTGVGILIRQLESKFANVAAYDTDPIDRELMGVGGDSNTTKSVYAWQHGRVRASSNSALQQGWPPHQQTAPIRQI